MSTLKHGEEVDWDDVKTNSTSDFMNLAEGNNVIRIVTKPYPFWVAWVRDSSGANRRIRSAVENCPLVRAGFQPKPRYYVGVIERSSGTVKILELPSSVMTGIQNYRQDPDYADVLQYDINIQRGPKGTPPAQLYTVIPKPQKKPLTAEEKELVAQFKGRVDIAKFAKTPTPEEVAEKLGVVLGKDQTPQVSVGRQTVPAGTTSRPTVSEEDFADFGDDDEL